MYRGKGSAFLTAPAHPARTGALGKQDLAAASPVQGALVTLCCHSDMWECLRQHLGLSHAPEQRVLAGWVQAGCPLLSQAVPAIHTALLGGGEKTGWFFPPSPT